MLLIQVSKVSVYKMKLTETFLTKNNRFYVYYYNRSIDDYNGKKGTPYYVGKGQGCRAWKFHKGVPMPANICDIVIIKSELFEDDALDLEEHLIELHGRINDLSGGILLNKFPSGRLTNHKGKRYEEIYGSKEKADEQRAKRSKIQKERGGYGPKTHSIETRRKISEKGKGRKLGPCPEDRKKKIRENRVPVTGERHHESKHWVLTSPAGEIYEQIGNLNGLCKKLGISFATMHSAFLNNRIPRCGKAAGWKITVKQKHDNSKA